MSANKVIRKYDLVMVFPNSDAATLQKSVEGVKAILTKRNAEIKSVKELGVKPLFHIQKPHTHGNFNCWSIESEPSMINQITTDLNVSSDIIKSIITLAG